MEQRRDIRRVALVILYQMDLSGETNPAIILKGLDDGLLEENGVKATPAIREAAGVLAAAAWAAHEVCDKQATLSAPTWPTHRQPAMDRAILRLAYHEILSGHAPAKVAINEAIELAKAFGSEKTPAFVNAVLDKITKDAPVPPEMPKPAKAPKNAAPAADADAWLNDAKQA